MSQTKKIIVIKIGTNTITMSDGRPDLHFMAGVAQQVENLKQNGFDVVLVSSGAIGCGMKILNLLNRPTENLALKQACAAIGQSELMRNWQMAFQNLVVSQHLVTHSVIKHDNTLHDFKKCLFEVLSLGAIPIINDNDAISTEEIDARFTDNDELAVEVARAIKADKLIILSDIHGLFSDNPKTNPEATLIEVVQQIDEEILNLAHGVSSLGTGGMHSKLLSIHKAMENEIEVCLTHGKLENAILSSFEVDFKGTRFVSNPKKS